LEYKSRLVNYGIIGLIQLELGYAESADISIEEALALYDKYLYLVLESQWIYCLYKSGKDKCSRQNKATDIRYYLLNDGNTLVSEGIDANYMDMINYSVFGLIKIEFEG